MAYFLRVSSLILCALALCAEQQVNPESFTYVLQAEGLAKNRVGVVSKLAGCGRDWIILDAFFENGSRWTTNELALVRKGKDNRKVIAYFSIGEAEDYRPYWDKRWLTAGKPSKAAPHWLAEENLEWKGNHRVRYWEPDWQRIVFAELRHIQDSGFDGVFLDIVDGYEAFEYDTATRGWIDNRKNPATGRTFREDMASFVTNLATMARAERPGFLVVPQNGEQLLKDRAYLSSISAVSVESLYKGKNKERLEPLRLAADAGKPVLDVEYAKPRKIASPFVILFTRKELDAIGTH